jgi:xylan 1,4-beta-xylosidase
LVWNYQDDDVGGPAANVDVKLSGLPATGQRVLLQHYRIDEDHSNAYRAWKQMGSPQQPTPEQYSKLESAGQLQLLESPRWVDVSSGTTEVRFSLPVQGLSLLELSW